MGQRIMLVDDEEQLLHTMEVALMMYGYSSISFNRAADAFARLIEAQAQDENFNLLVTDIHMPGMDGCELLRKVREAAIKIPALLITGGEISPELKRLIDEGMLLLRKPFTLQQFIDSVQAMSTTDFIVETASPPLPKTASAADDGRRNLMAFRLRISQHRRCL